MNQPQYTVEDIKELMDLSLANGDLVFGMLGVPPEEGATATGLVSPSQLEALYDLASRLYAASEYTDADPLFQMLCCYKNDDPRFWMGLGGCRQAQGNVLSAAQAYMAAGRLQGFASPQPLLFAALCLLRLGLREIAMPILRLLTLMGDPQSAVDSECHARAQTLLENLQRDAVQKA